MKLYQVV